MQYTVHYTSPLGGILIAADDVGLTGVWFDGEKYYAEGLASDHREGDHPVLEQTRRWLDIYFSGREPEFMPPLHIMGTRFQMTVWELLCQIPYGETTTYGALAKEIAAKRGIQRMSAQAVGGAVGHNAIAILIPCHRVIGSDDSLTGYAAGMDKKDALLRLEGIDVEGFTRR